MRVLITQPDLFRAVGGGQTFYRGLVARHPRVDFFYPRVKEPADAPRPPNAHPLDTAEAYTPPDLHYFSDPGPPARALSDFLNANNIARAAAGMAFDVVDTPDYEHLGLFLRGALARYDVGFGKIALSMHGRVSTSMALNWTADGTRSLGQLQFENLQYAAADVRYFISRSYQDEWAAVHPGRSHHVDPLWVFRLLPRRPYQPAAGPPDLHFVGRTERLKGPHLFLQLLWWLPRESYRTATLTGPSVTDPNGVSSSDHLRAMIARRGLDARLAPCAAPDELARVFAAKCVVFAPSVYDTLNLTALEALFAGCPTVLGSGAGACRYLAERFSNLPYTRLDLGRFFAEVPAVERLLAGYDDHRAALAAALRDTDFDAVGPNVLDAYDSDSAADPAAVAEAADWDRRLAAECPFHPAPDRGAAARANNPDGGQPKGGKESGPCVVQSGRVAVSRWQRVAGQFAPVGEAGG